MKSSTYFTFTIDAIIAHNATDIDQSHIIDSIQPSIDAAYLNYSSPCTYSYNTSFKSGATQKRQ